MKDYVKETKEYVDYASDAIDCTCQNINNSEWMDKKAHTKI